jgi:DNA polymerase I-like protein with 3'-5' exonuclease and polymerase domains
LLEAELSRYKPKVLVAVGDEALKAVVPSLRSKHSTKRKVESIIGKYQGSILDSERPQGMKVVPMYHTAFIMRMNWEHYYIGIRWLKRVKAIEEGKIVRESDPTFITAPRIEQALGFLNSIQDNPDQEWWLDIETRGDTIDCFGLSVPGLFKDTAICIPIQTTTGPYWSPEEEAAIWKALGRAMERNGNLSNQNLMYDIDYLLDFGCEPSGLKFDPMAAQKFLYPEFEKGLGFTTALYTTIPYYKDDGKTWKKKVPNEKVWTYNCMDVWATPKVAMAIRKDLNEAGLMDVYEKRVQRFLPIALEMEKTRLKVNEEWHKKLGDILSDEILSTHSKLTDELGGFEVNVRSSAQVQKVLYDILRLPVKKKRGSQSITTGENIIKELRAENPQLKALNLILSERHLRKKKSDWIDMEFDPDYHIPSMPQVNATKTGRWAFNSSPKWRGGNIQTMPKVLRLMVEPPPGRVFVQPDLSQGEVRYVAAESRCMFLNNIFAAGGSVHKAFGKRFSGVEPKKDTLEYDAYKSTVHGYDYMMGAKRLAIETGISYQLAEQMYDTYGREVYEIERWWGRIKEEALRAGRLVTPLGRVRQCFAACAMVTNTGTLADEIWRDLVSWKPQATIPDVLNEGMWKVWEGLGDWVWFHQQGHDSYLASIPEGRLEDYIEFAKPAHRVPILIDKEVELIIPSEFSWGYLWGAMKSYKEGEKGVRNEWEDYVVREGVFALEGKGGIKERLYSLM